MVMVIVSSRSFLGLPEALRRACPVGGQDDNGEAAENHGHAGVAQRAEDFVED